MTRATWLVLAAGLAAGCGEVSSPPRGEVKGTVALADGKPPVDVVVVFTPDGAAGSEDFAVVAADGTFAMNLMTGKYKVTVEPGAKKMSGGGKTSRYPAQYASPATTPVSVTIPDDAGKPLEIVLK